MPSPTRTATHYIDVCPRLTLNGLPLALDALSIFSVISKFMGKYPAGWERHLKGIGQRKYNMVHFTPLMERGSSNSPYSIQDQLAFDPYMFPNGESDVAKMVNHMEREHGLLAMTDVVWNHTANSSKWLEGHPEAGYTVETAPWLEPALKLDTALLDFSDRLESLGLPTELKSMDDLYRIMDSVKTHVIDNLNLWQHYVVHVERQAQAAVEAWMEGRITYPDGDFDALSDIKNQPLSRKAEILVKYGFMGAGQMGPRFHRQIDLRVGAALLTATYGRYDSKDSGTPSRGAVHHTMSEILDELNKRFYREYDDDVKVIIDQILDRVKYVRLDDHGLKLGHITPENPLIETYFTRLPQNATTMKHSTNSLALVNNGWIWAADAMKDNAGSDSRAYLRREVIVWSDCVKLRYGKSPEDNPFLWDYMTRYTRLMAKYFTGFRIDNCHSTPLVVAEYLLDQAREVRPDLAVFAELFTGNEAMDYVFVKRLGLSALIREAMQAWNTGELSRLVHMHGGRPIGSFEIDKVSANESTKLLQTKLNGVNGINGINGVKPVKKETVHQIRQSPVHALFMDCTHDNEVPAQKRDARDTLPNAALVNMCACATGSVMGYDEIYPKLIDLVHEPRQYDSPYSGKEVKIGSGMGGVKKLLNLVHTRMGQEGYDETFIHHEGQYITVHRVHPKSRKGIFVIAHSAFPGYGNATPYLTPVLLAGTKAKLIGAWSLEVDDGEAARKAAAEDKDLLRGLPSRTVDLKNVGLDIQERQTVITIPEHFSPGSIALFETWIPGAEHSDGLDSFISSGTGEAFGKLDLVDLNFLMYRCGAEELDSSGGKEDVYIIPNYGKLVYAGLQGWWSVLRDVIYYNDLGHPICSHLRDGQWALDHIVGRLERMAKRDGYKRLQQPAMWLRQRFDAIRKVPSFLLPRYFGLVVRAAYDAARARGLQLMSADIQHGQNFLQDLALVSIQQTGYMKSASLYPVRSVPCLAAGLPHFSSDWARCWGRDVFISIRGLYLGTGRYADAKEHIVAFASVLKHGMIPNLLSGGKSPRYNSRDSIWFFLQTIQDYTKMVPNGMQLLQEKVSRRFLPYDDTWFEYDDPRAYSKESTIEEIIQEALQRHATGLSFREHNAGPELDMQMKPQGFQIDVHVEWNTGMIFGGNQWNCGTWMDKMGESEKAGSKGFPGTPRDGAAIEITGLAYSTLAWVAQLHKDGKFFSSGVKTSEERKVTFSEWASLIQENFEYCYYIPLDRREDSKYDVNSSVVNRRGIYKDLYQSGKEYEDYQLRTNFPIAMTVAPELFTPAKALGALELADSVLRGPTGMATLDPTDLNYRPYYNNSEDSTDFATSKGRNYHQGPEWLWPTGFFLRALLKFDLIRRNTKEERTEAFQQVTRRLTGCKKAIRDSPWAGLTELTNRNGDFCADSVSYKVRIRFARHC